MCDAYLNSYKMNADRECLGSKPEGSHEYVFKTYKEVIDISILLGNGINKLGLAKSKKEYKNFDLKFIGLYAKNREEYAETDIAAALFGFCSVAIYDTLGPEAMTFILE